MLKLEPNSTNHNYNGLKTNYLSWSFLCVDFNVNSVMFPVIMAAITHSHINCWHLNYLSEDKQ